VACHSGSLTELPRAAKFTKGIIRLVWGGANTDQAVYAPDHFT